LPHKKESSNRTDNGEKKDPRKKRGKNIKKQKRQGNSYCEVHLDQAGFPTRVNRVATLVCSFK
jgi:hypothetical protein